MAAPATLAIASDLSEVRRAAAWLRAAVAGLMTEERAADLELAAVEALTNVVRHAYPERPGEPIGLSLETGQDGVTLSIQDHGIPFPADRLIDAVKPFAEAENLDDLSDGGRGLHLIAAVVDEVEVRRDGARNTMTLRMRSGRDEPE